ncbi:MAG TPA: crotonase/enoyl-CoA hydratase family protein [Acidimicrobiales bacterium]
MVNYEVEGHVALITINRPEARNAVNGEVAQGIEAAIDRLEEDNAVWIGILTGDGPVFCAGADLKAINSGKGAELMTQRGGFAGLVQRERTKPLIAAVNGPAYAGGCEIALACDLIVAAEGTTFSVPEVKRCLVAAAGALFRLPAALPRNTAMELVLTGDPISAERAHELGMVSRLTPEGGAIEGARVLAGQINANAPVAVRESRKVIAAAPYESDEAGFAASNAAMGVAMSSSDVAEGLTAFIEKRPPEWKGV